MGADLILDPSVDDVSARIADVAPLGVDGTLEMSGVPSSIELAMRHTRPGGRISLLGLFAESMQSLDLNALIFRGLNVQGIVGRRLWETWEQMHWLLTEKGLDVSPVITHEMPYTEIERAMEVLEAGQAGKVVLDFTGT
jgi:threonine 3-dehydrogenase